MEIEKDFDKIFSIGESMNKENIDFRSFLKWKCGRDLDGLSRKYFNQVAPEIDCTECANCCKKMRPFFSEEDITTCAIEKNMGVEKFRETYLEEGGTFGKKEWRLRDLPCLFLEKNRCTIYKNRPENCREFPHLTTDDQISKTWKYVTNYSVCPIMFNVVELLKEHFDWDQDSFELPY